MTTDQMPPLPKIINSIFETCRKGGAPLNEDQQMLIAGSAAVWLEAYASTYAEQQTADWKAAAQQSAFEKRAFEQQTAELRAELERLKEALFRITGHYEQLKAAIRGGGI